MAKRLRMAWPTSAGDRIVHSTARRKPRYNSRETSVNLCACRNARTGAARCDKACCARPGCTATVFSVFRTRTVYKHMLHEKEENKCPGWVQHSVDEHMVFAAVCATPSRVHVSAATLGVSGERNNNRIPIQYFVYVNACGINRAPARVHSQSRSCETCACRHHGHQDALRFRLVNMPHRT